MVEVNINSHPVYYVILSYCDCKNDIILKNSLIEFVHLSAFLKIVDEMAKSDIYVNAVYYNMQLNMFVREAYANLQFEFGNIFNIKYYEELESKLEEYITVIEDDCETICEPAFSGYCKMMGIISNLLDQLMFTGFEFDEEKIYLASTVQELKHVNRCLITHILY